jgi:hypothetical protein
MGMHIVQRSRGDLDLFRLKGRLDGGAVEQLAFILRAMPGGRRIQFDFRRVDNAAAPEAARLLKSVLARRPEGRGLLFSGIPHTAARRHALEGLPPALFV